MNTPVNTAHISRHQDSGFTMLEVLTAMLILGLLASIAIPIYMSQRQVAASQMVEVTLTNASIALEQEAGQNVGKYPVSLPTSVAIPEAVSVDYAPSQDRRGFCVQAQEHDSDDIFRISTTADGRLTDIEHGECEEQAAPLDSPVLNADANTQNQALLSWAPIDGVERYEVVNATTGAVLTTLPAPGATTWTSESLEEATEFRVIAYALDDRAPSQSSIVRITPVAAPTTEPPTVTIAHTQLQGASIGVRIEWSAVRNAATYQVINGSNGNVLGTVTAAQRAWDEWFTADTFLVVVAKNASGVELSRSEQLLIEVPKAEAPTVVINTDGGVIGFTWFELGWTEVEGAVLYQIINADTGEPLATTSSNWRAWGDGIEHTTRYQVRAVFADDSRGEPSNTIEIRVHGG